MARIIRILMLLIMPISFTYLQTLSGERLLPDGHPQLDKSSSVNRQPMFKFEISEDALLEDLGFECD